MGNVARTRRRVLLAAAALCALPTPLRAQSVDVLVAGATIGVRAAKAATPTHPIVLARSSDPVATGLVASLARPGGNLTGTALPYGDGLAGKGVERPAVKPDMRHASGAEEQPTLVELVVNARTARSLGLPLPGTLGRRADRIIG